MSKNEEKLKRLLSLMDEDSLTKEDFLKAFQKVVDLVKRVEAQHLKAIKDIRATHTKLVEKLKSDNNFTQSDLKTLINKETATLIKRFEKQSNEINSKLLAIRDGKDADEEIIVDRVIDKIELPEFKELVLDGGIEIRDKLESLVENERLDKSALKGIEDLEAEIAELKKRPARFGGGTSDASVSYSLGRILKTETPSGVINGTNKVYTVTSHIHSIFSFGINGMVIHSGEYTVSGSTITFTTAIDASLSGTSFEIKYA